MGKISAGTAARTAALAVTLVNTILTAAGKNPLPFSDTQAFEWVSEGALIVTAVIAWWKNNSFTKAAREGDKVMKVLKSTKSTENM